MNMTSLEGKTAVVTGGSRGIGRAITEAFLRAGADVVVNYNKTPVDELKALAAELGRQLVDVQADVSQTADCERLIEAALGAFKKVDVLVNNAGITRDTLLMRMDEAAWDAVIATNLKSVFSCCRAAVKPMIRARAGSIINISSVSGIMGNAGQCNYAASKAGVIGFSKSLAREVAARGVRVNVVAPGFITSDMTDSLDEKIREKVLQEIPLGRFGQPADIANAVLFLASDLGGFMTGTTMVVDGGMAM